MIYRRKWGRHSVRTSRDDWDCADKLFFMTRSVECFADRVSKLWETADLEGYAQRRGGREAS